MKHFTMQVHIDSSQWDEAVRKFTITKKNPFAVMDFLLPHKETDFRNLIEVDSHIEETLNPLGEPVLIDVTLIRRPSSDFAAFLAAHT